MKEKTHTIPNEILEKIGEAGKRHSGIIAGWLNRSHGKSTANRRVIQETVMEVKAKLKRDDNSDKKV